MTRPLGATGLEVTPLTAGGAPLGSMPKNFGYDVAFEDGVATARAALTGPIRAVRIATPDGVHQIPKARGDYPEFYRLLSTALRDGAPLPVDPSSSVAMVKIMEAATAGTP